MFVCDCIKSHEHFAISLNVLILLSALPSSFPSTFPPLIGQYSTALVISSLFYPSQSSVNLDTTSGIITTVSSPAIVLSDFVYTFFFL